MNEFKDDFAVETDRRTLEEAFVGADVFCGLSKGNVVSKEMVKTMADNPIIFAMANPDPEITYEDAVDARKDVIMATGRSDYPNQVNNVLGFPFIFRGALDVHATKINEEMKRAAAYALAKLAKEEVPEAVKQAYGEETITYGREYIIPKPFDPRVLTWVAPAVAKAAMDSGVARKEITDFEKYEFDLNIRMGRSHSIMTKIYRKAGQHPKRVVFPEGNEPKIIKAAQLSVDYNIAQPVLIGNKDEINAVAEEYGYDLTGIYIVDNNDSELLEEYVEEFYKLRQRKGVTRKEARRKLVNNRNYFGSMMVHQGHACSMISGLSSNYPDTVRPALEIIGKDPKYNKVSGIYIVSTKKDTYFLADTTINVNPDANTLADIALQAADFVTNFDIKPQVAMLSYSNFGSAQGKSPETIREALKIIKERDPNLSIDGEMQADTAVESSILQKDFPFSTLSGEANTLVFPDLNSGNIAYKLLARIGGANLIVAILQGLDKSVHILQRGSEVNQILDMVAIAVVDANHKGDKCIDIFS